MAKRMLTLTLMGLMMAMLVFPVCASALEEGEEAPKNLEAVQADPYDAMPTLKWSAVSGATSFTLTAGGDPINITDPNLGADKKWAGRKAEGADDAAKEIVAKAAAASVTAGTAGTNCVEYAEGENEGEVICWYEYPLDSDLTGDWTVAAIRAAETKDGDDPGFDGTNSTTTGDAITVLGDITLALTASKTGEAAIEETITVTVSMDNQTSTNGDVPVDSTIFSIGYNADVVTPATAATGLNRAAAITPAVSPSGSSDAAKVEITLAGEITAGTGDIVELAFTVDAAGDNTFALVPGDINITSATVNPPTGEDRNPAVAEAGDPLTINVAEPVTQGDLDGNDAVELADAVIALKVLAGLPLTAEETASVEKHVAAYPSNVDVGVLLYILKTVATG